MICKLTGKEGKPVDAHVIPESFFEIDPEEKGITRVLTNTEGVYPKRAPKGIYDKTILTVEGERIFSQWDDYADRLLLKEQDKLEAIHHKGREIAFKLDAYNYNLLKLFALSVVWRASVSSHYFYRKVRLGPHEEIIRAALLNNDPGNTDWYSVVFAAWSDKTRNPGIMDPFREKYDGLNYYRFYLSRYIMYVKIDERSATGSMKAIQLMENEPLYIVSREFEKSKEFPIMVNMAHMHAK